MNETQRTRRIKSVISLPLSLLRVLSLLCFLPPLSANRTPLYVKSSADRHSYTPGIIVYMYLSPMQAGKAAQPRQSKPNNTTFTSASLRRELRTLSPRWGRVRTKNKTPKVQKLRGWQGFPPVQQ